MPEARARNITNMASGHAFIAVLLALAAATFCPGQGARGTTTARRSGSSLSLTFVANMGVMAVTGGRKILIDALFDTPGSDYRGPAPDVLEKIVNGRAPFDGVDLALVTHDHPDHFAARVALDFLTASGTAVVVAPADAVAAMRDAASGWAAAAPRVVPLDLAIGERATRTVNGIRLTAIRTLHSGNTPSPMNLMYIVTFGGWTLFHEGDSPGDVKEYERLGLEREGIDLALVHFWFPLSPEQARYLQEVLRPDHIVLGHLPIRLEADAPVKIDAVRTQYKDMVLLLPGIGTRVYRRTPPPAISGAATQR